MSAFNQISNSVSIEEDPSFPYLPPCMRCQPIIDYTTLRFHSNTIPYPVQIFNDEDSEYKFGILDIKIRTEIPINTKHIHMFFTIDASGSMSDICSDGRTKMAHIHHTLENMLRIFHENSESNISVHVQSFDTVIKTIIRDVPNIRDSNIEELISLVQRISPCGSTNIELALVQASQEIESYHVANPEHEIVHIFLTDGDITSGSRDYTHLLELVPKNCTNIFIGYGLDHDSELLSHLSTEKGNEYRFVDALEKAGLVYGEVIHSILYKAIEDVTLSASGAELYNYQTNTWSNDLEIGNLLSEQMKTFHVRSKTVDECYISINGKTIVKTRQYQTINIYEKQTDVSPLNYLSETNDLGVYLFRQRTQELLYESRQISQFYKKSYIHDSMRDLDDYTEIESRIKSLQQQQKDLKEKMKEFHKIMTNYMKDKNIENDPIMKMLCDDIYIAHKTTGTTLGGMYSCARQTSNGRQQTYMCSATHTQEIYDNHIRPPGILRLQRQTNVPSIGFRETTQVFVFDNMMHPIDQGMDNDNEIDNYAPSQDFLSPFSSDGVVTLMREVSGNHSIGRTLADDDNDDEQEEKTNSIN
jgi:Mg-chelatase subunit ChlD